MTDYDPSRQPHLEQEAAALLAANPWLAANFSTASSIPFLTNSKQTTPVPPSTQLDRLFSATLNSSDAIPVVLGYYEPPDYASIETAS
ncbi:hypothetical protein MN608_10963 [Microdochium nivale]|nr:hypothetical protein MN608_10963 [Microdochium nivale]